MKLVIDGYSKLFTVPLGAKFGRIWKTLLKYLSEHNRTIVSAKLFKDSDTQPLQVTNTVVSDYDNTATTDFYKLEIESIPRKHAIVQLYKTAQELIEDVDKDVFIPLVKLLEDDSENRTDKIKTAILTNSKEQVQVFNEMFSVLYYLSKTPEGADLETNVELIESIYPRIMNAIEHNDMSTLIQLISVEMKQYFTQIKDKLASLKY